MNPIGFQNPRCYARELGGCCTEISKEHYVTEALLKEVAEGERAVRVSNLPKLPPIPIRPEEIGLRALTGHFLCRTHNSLLSDFDTTAVTLFKHLDFLNGTSRHPAQPQVAVSGDQLERWMLKTLIGGLYGGTFPLMPGMDLEGQPPPIEYLRTLFNNQPFPPGQGLFLIAGLGGQPFAADHNVLRISISPSTEGRVIGIRVWMFGILFSLILMNFTDRLPDELQEATFKPTRIVIMPKGEVRFEWDGESGADRALHLWYLGQAN